MNLSLAEVWEALKGYITEEKKNPHLSMVNDFPVAIFN